MELIDRHVSRLAVEPVEAPAYGWDALVSEDTHATFCHLGGWRHIFENVLGHECLYRAATDDTGNCVGVLPLVRVRSRLFGDYLVSTPFLNYGGAIGSAEAQRALNDWAAAEARRLGVDLLELRTRHGTPDDDVLRRVERKITVVLPLPASADTLWEEGFNAKLRSQIRRAGREGLDVRFGAEQAGAFYEVFSRNMRDLGTPVLPRGLFESLAAVFPQHVQYCAVYRDAEPIAASAGFHFRGEFEMTWAGSLREYNRLAPNMLLYWACLQEAIRRGCTVFNFGRCSSGTGTHRFKLQWGGQEVTLPWLHAGPGGVQATPNPESRRFRTAIGVWRRLPLFVTNRLGPPLARRIP